MKHQEESASANSPADAVDVPTSEGTNLSVAARQTRQTRQREAIARVIEAAAGPLTAREIHARARGEMSALGIATVYRALKLLLSSREIKSVVLPSGEPRYESASRGHHDHFQCRACEQVFDLGCPLRLPRGTALPGGFVVEDHEVTLFGLCPGCTPAHAQADSKGDQAPQAVFQAP